MTIIIIQQTFGNISMGDIKRELDNAKGYVEDRTELDLDPSTNSGLALMIFIMFIFIHSFNIILLLIIMYSPISHDNRIDYSYIALSRSSIIVFIC